MLDSRNTNSKVNGKSISQKDNQTVVGTVEKTVSTIEEMPIDKDFDRKESEAVSDNAPTWSYVHVHYKSVDRLEKDCATLKDAPIKCFVDRTAPPALPKGKRNIKTDSPTYESVSGLVFFQGEPTEIQKYLWTHYRELYLVKDSATGVAAVIPDKQMVPFMKVAPYGPAIVRIVDRPISYYANGHKLVRMLTGILKGHEGYVVRKAGDRKFFMPFGNKSLAISHVHKEQFQEVGT